MIYMKITGTIYSITETQKPQVFSEEGLFRLINNLQEGMVHSGLSRRAGPLGE